MYTAIIVEPRKHAALPYVLNNILTNLSDDWNIIICHGTRNAEYIQHIIKYELYTFLSRITLVNLGVEDLNYYDKTLLFNYNTLWTSKDFYDIIPTETFLKFETDSIIIPKNAHIIKDFMEYDYVGAPWRDAQIGNGGLSLRKKTKMLELINKVEYMPPENEDLFFSQWLNRVNNDFSIHVHKPSFEKSKMFSVETVFYSQPFGCHKPWEYNPEFVELHPEVQTLQRLQFTIP